ncbi:RNA polymerase sigma factor SigZ [Aliifodinibius sp. S!AR15-10]|uniref:RNA polymerase sigma factor SigZ n=1 Tax=Aliifodinibius sp. S!AR15-10 TaxID=2950437 RepID=UPI0028555880|nr:RNA polymerase sigma factor SigZ [Aliifodinibius sp. S!AR15-10]MDR8392907.1 RNA polymerase sigma factor SigZ [Aliifodinibius sp. S!AR15-10]
MASDNLNTETIWRKFSDHIRSFIRSKVSSESEVEDVLQDIFMRIHQGLDQLNDENKVQSWIFGIARRALADHYRNQSTRPTDKDVDTEDRLELQNVDESINLADYEGPHDVHEEVLSWLVPMIDELPEKYRIPLKMADVEGKKQQEIADHLGLSLSGAKSRVQRGRKKLGEVLAACCDIKFGEEGRAVAFRRLRDDECESCD